MLNIELETYTGLPCATRKFSINGIDASKDDFGESIDTSAENAPEYGCGHREFIPNDENMESAMKKYNITASEFYEVQQKLQAELLVGRCALCL